MWCLFAAISRGHTVAAPQILAERMRSTQLERTHETESPVVRYLQQPVYVEQPPHYVLFRRSPRSTQGAKATYRPNSPSRGLHTDHRPPPPSCERRKGPNGPLAQAAVCLSQEHRAAEGPHQRGTRLPPRSRGRRPAPLALLPPPSGAHVQARSPVEGHREGLDRGPRYHPWTGCPATCDMRGEDGASVWGFLPRAARGHGGADTQEHPASANGRRPASRKQKGSLECPKLHRKEHHALKALGSRTCGGPPCPPLARHLPGQLLKEARPQGISRAERRGKGQRIPGTSGGPGGAQAGRGTGRPATEPSETGGECRVLPRRPVDATCRFPGMPPPPALLTGQPPGSHQALRAHVLPSRKGRLQGAAPITAGPLVSGALEATEVPVATRRLVLRLAWLSAVSGFLRQLANVNQGVRPF